MQIIHYHVNPQGLDTYWTTPLELFCHLYCNESERTRLRTMVDQLGNDNNRIFLIYHRCAPWSICLMVGQTDESFVRHIEYLLQDIGFDLSRDRAVQGISAILHALS
jgi:hypothetical protein